MICIRTASYGDNVSVKTTYIITLELIFLFIMPSI